MYTGWPQLNMYSSMYSKCVFIFTSGSPSGLILHEATACFRKQNVGENVDNWGIEGEDKKISSHSTNLFKYIQYKSKHVHYSAADITKSNVTKNPAGKVGERRKKLVHSNRDSIAFGRRRECNGLLLYRLL